MKVVLDTNVLVAGLYLRLARAVTSFAWSRRVS